MTKQAVIAIVVAVLIIMGAAGAFLYSQSKPSNEANQATTAAEVTKAPENTMSQSTISEILSSGKSSKCTFSSGTDNTQTSGVIYTSGQNARGDFETTAAGKETTTHMIRNGNTFYMWGDSVAMGVKMAMSVEDLASRMEGSKEYGSFDPDQQMDINCVTWSEDATLFSPPTSVKFTSIGNMMPTGAAKSSVAPTSSAANPTGTSSSNECNICNALTGQAKTACMQQFSCN